MLVWERNRSKGHRPDLVISKREYGAAACVDVISDPLFNELIEVFKKLAPPLFEILM